MSGCCDTSGYGGVFGRATARRNVASFKRRGLDSTAGPMVGELRRRGLEGMSVLEVGAGSGTALVSMLEAGASTATGVDISPGYEEASATLVAERGLGDRVTWRTGDVVTLADDIGEHDVVFLNRVVCCYPAMDSLLATVGARAGRYLALSYPRDRWLFRLFIRLGNAWLRVRRNSFRVFLHDPGAIAGRLAALGLVPAATGTTPGWHWTVWERQAG